MITRTFSGKKASILFLLILVIFLPSLMNYCVYLKLESELPFKLSGQFSPYFYRPGFSLSQTKFFWDDHIQIVSGDLQVQYSLSNVFNSGGVRIQVEARNLKAELLGSWSQLQGVKETVLESLTLDVLLTGGQLREIYDVSVKSPEFQFHLKRSEK